MAASAAGGIRPVTAADAPATDERTVAGALNEAAEWLLVSRPRAALTALAFVETTEPDNPWMWFYRGTAHLQLRDPHEAMRCYDRALDVLGELGEPDPALTEKIRLHRVRARRQVFSATAQIGLAYDTNVTYLGNETVNRVDLISGRQDGKFASEFRLDYAPVADATDMLVVGTRLAQIWHFSIEEYDEQDYGTYVRYAHRIDRHFEPAIEYDYNVVLLDDTGFLSDHALTASLTYHWDAIDSPVRPDRSDVYYRFEARDFLYETEPMFDRDGYAHAVGAEQHFLVTPIDRWTWDLSVGYRLTSIMTEGDEYDRMTQDAYLGVGIPLINPDHPDEFLLIADKELRLRFDVQWHRADYRQESLIDHLGRRRRDQLMLYGWSISQTLVDDPDRGRLTLGGIVHWTDAHSNVQVEEADRPNDLADPFTYDKVIYGLQLIWQW